MNKISACIVIRNEEKTIKRCLDSLNGVVDEIIIVHDGDCSDKTLKICERYKARIFIRPFIGAMEAHIPFAFSQVKNNWILRIDADEFLGEDLRREIFTLIDSEIIDSYSFLWPIWDGSNYITSKWPYKKCLFRKEKISFLGVIHFLTEVDGQERKCELLLEHKPNYNNYTWNIFRKKWLAWARIQAETYLSTFNKVEKYNYLGKDWPKKIKLRIKHPIILMPFEFIITVFKNLFNGAYKEGVVGLKVALMFGVYRVMLNYYIFKIKIKNR